jgi:hypothetical protein
MNPMYLAYRPPQMLPTTTLNPMPTASATGKSNSDKLWWFGLGLTGLGGLLYMGPRRMGIHL